MDSFVESLEMEVLYFIAFVSVCAVIVVAAVRPSKKKQKEQVRQQHKLRSKKAQTELLSTPANYTLSRTDQVWRSKRRKHVEDVTVTNRFVPRSKSAGEPEYDGYSRRDRHHVIVGTAHIKEADQAAEPSMSEVEYKQGKSAS